MAIFGALIRPKARQRRNLRHVLIEGFTCAHKSNVAGATLKISHHNFFRSGAYTEFSTWPFYLCCRWGLCVWPLVVFTGPGTSQTAMCIFCLVSLRYFWRQFLKCIPYNSEIEYQSLAHCARTHTHVVATAYTERNYVTTLLTCIASWWTSTIILLRVVSCFRTFTHTPWAAVKIGTTKPK